MKNLIALGQSFIAIAMIAFGVQHLLYRDFVTRVVPKLPLSPPGRPFLACLVGAFLVVTGAAILVRKAARWAALLLGALLLVSFALLQLPLLIGNPHNGGLWTSAGKTLALSGSSLLVAGSLPARLISSRGWLVSVVKAWERFIPLGRIFLGAFLLLGGIQHFLYAGFVATLVPAWIPGHLFWTYFAGVALIAGGVGMIIPMTTRLAASLSGLMVFLWVILLHIPRAVADLHNSNETTAVFEALAISGAAILVAVVPAAGGGSKIVR